MTDQSPRVAVLGAGIMGCSLALLLARRGEAVHAEPKIETRLNCHVTGLAQDRRGWRIHASRGD